MKRIQRGAAELEAELLRLNTLVRERRRQLTRLEQCPHKDCESRQVWHEVVEQQLATQVGKIGKRVQTSKSKPRKPGKAKTNEPEKGQTKSHT